MSSVGPEPPRERGSSAGAWAAAALVLALGALIFAVLAHVRVSELEDRIGVLESENALRSPLTSLVDPLDPVPTTPISSPEGGGEPPDPSTARADVIAAFSAVYDSRAAIDDRLRLVDDTTGVAAALRQAAAGPNAAVINSATVNVNDVTFSSPTRATVVYGLAVPGQPPILGRSGEARVDGGAWKVTRATVCADLTAVGAPC